MECLMKCTILVRNTASKTFAEILLFLTADNIPFDVRQAAGHTGHK